MKITDEMVKIAMNSLALTDFPDCNYPDDWSPEELRSFELQARNAPHFNVFSSVNRRTTIFAALTY